MADGPNAMESLRQKLLAQKQKGEFDFADDKYIPFKKSVSSLYDSIQIWIKPLSNEGLLRFEPGDSITINEYRVMPYEINVGWLIGSGPKIELRPISCMIIGAKGRVDMFSGSGSSVMLILDGEDRWNAADRSRRPMTWPLNQDTFLELVDQLTN